MPKLKKKSDFMTKKELALNFLNKLGVDAFVFFDEPSIFYFTGLKISDNACVITENGIFLTADMRYFEAAERLNGVAVLKNTEGVFKSLEEIFSAEGIRACAVNEGKITLKEHGKLSSLVSVKNGEAEINALRAFKDESDLNSIKKAQKITDAAFSHILSYLKEGVSELDIVSELEYFMKKNQAETAFNTIVLFGSKTSIPHGEPSNNKLKANMPVLFDFGAKINGLCSDMSRSFFFGEKAPEIYKDAHETVLKAQNAALSSIKAGLTGKECDSFAREIINSGDFENLFTHSLGHGVGYEIHEWPNFAPRADCPIPANAVLSVEPGIYLKGRFGVRIEDIVFTTQNEAVNLTRSPKFLNFYQ